MKKLRYYNMEEEDTDQLAKRLAEFLRPGDFLAFFGDMGAGKTTFIRSMAEAWGITDVTSPTFTIVWEHAGKFPFFHFDAYRLEDEDELYAIGFEEYLQRGGVIAMEWCERTPGALPADRLDVQLLGSGADLREILFTAHGQRFEALLEDVVCNF